MSTTHDDATTWRDLADALTREQLAYIEEWERHPEIPPMADGSAPPAEQHASALLFTAREYVGQNAAGVRFADVAPPPEDARHYPWEHDGKGNWYRFFAGGSRDFGEAQVTITGLQYNDGRILRSINVEGAEDIDAPTARQLAAALIAAADELERLQ